MRTATFESRIIAVYTMVPQLGKFVPQLDELLEDGDSGSVATTSGSGSIGSATASGGKQYTVTVDQNGDPVEELHGMYDEDAANEHMRGMYDEDAVDLDPNSIVNFGR